MQGRSQKSERPSTAASARSAAAGRTGIRPPSNRPSSLRHPQNHHATIASRIARNAAPSPAESLSSNATSGTKRKERDFEVDTTVETNIDVVVRCRGRNEREVSENSAVVVATEGVKGKLVELSMGPTALSNKTYNFDRVFSQAADQSMIYDDVVKPILEEVCMSNTGWYHVERITDYLLDAWRVQLHNIRVWSNWYWQNIHHVRKYDGNLRYSL